MFKDKKLKKKSPTKNFFDLETLNVLNENWDENPFRVITHFINEAPGENFASLAFSIAHLYTEGLITAEQLAIIGLDTEELNSIVSSVRNNDTYEEFSNDLLVTATIREYDKIVKEIMTENNLNIDMYDEFKKELCKFAADNSITDLSVAFKFFSKTEEEQFSKFKARN